MPLNRPPCLGKGDRHGPSTARASPRFPGRWRIERPWGGVCRCYNLSVRIGGLRSTPGAERGMRVSLFITCFNDTIFPQTGRAVVRLLERLGHTVEFPMDQTCCGQMHYNTGFQLEAIPLVRRFVEVFEDRPRWSSRPSASCVGMVRHMYPHAAELAGDPKLAGGGRGHRAQGLRAVRVPGQQAGRRGRRGLLSAPGDLSPDLPLAADAPRGRRSAQAAPGGPGDRPRRAAAGRGVLRVRRDVRGEERRYVDGDARRQDPLRARHPGRGLRLGRQLVPDAHRRGLAPPEGGRGGCPPRRDPGVDRRNVTSDQCGLGTSTVTHRRNIKIAFDLQPRRGDR